MSLNVLILYNIKLDKTTSGITYNINKILSDSKSAPWIQLSIYCLLEKFNRSIARICHRREFPQTNPPEKWEPDTLFFLKTPQIQFAGKEIKNLKLNFVSSVGDSGIKTTLAALSRSFYYLPCASEKTILKTKVFGSRKNPWLFVPKLVPSPKSKGHNPNCE